MLATIIRKEILENILSYRFPLFLLICAVLILSSLYVNYLTYEKRTSDYNEQVRLANDAIASSRTSDLHFGRIPLKGFVQPSPMSVFAGGFEASLPLYYEFLADGFKAGETAVGDESVLSTVGKLDFLFIIQMIVALIVLLFASDVIAGEKELGTLRGTLSNSVPRYIVLLGKIVGGSVAVWLPFLIVFLLGAILLSLTSFPLADLKIAGRLLIIFVVTSVFIVEYFTLGVMISTSASRSRSALVGILISWIVLQLVIPKASDMIAAVLYPIRTETVVSMEESLITKSLDHELATVLGKEYEAIFGRGFPLRTDLEPSENRDRWEVFKSDMRIRYQQRKMEQLREVDRSHRRNKSVQQSIARLVSIISPSAAFTRFVTDLCGTGEIDKENTYEAVQTHQQVLDEALYSHVQKTTVIMPSGGTASSSSIDQFVDIKTLPGFTVPRASLSEVIEGNGDSLASIAFWLFAPFAVAFVRFLRYDVR